LDFRKFERFIFVGSAGILPAISAYARKQVSTETEVKNSESFSAFCRTLCRQDARAPDGKTFFEKVLFPSKFIRLEKRLMNFNFIFEFVSTKIENLPLDPVYIKTAHQKTCL
jgi:hypothetical protein